MIQKAFKHIAMGLFFTGMLSLTACTNPVSVIYNGEKSDTERVMSGALKNEDGSRTSDLKYDYCKLVSPRMSKGSQTSKQVSSSGFIKITKPEHPVHLRAGSRKPLPDNIRKLAIDVCADKDFLQQELESDFRPATKVTALAMTTLGEENWLIFNKASNSCLL